MIKLVVFDLYGLILSSGYPDTSRYLAKLYGGQPEKYQAIMYKKYFNLAATRKITQKQAWVLAVRELGLPISWQKVRTIHYKLMTMDKRLISLSQKLETKGYTVLVLSKNTRSQLADNCQRFKIKKIFKHVINTWELNLPKASEETLQVVLQRFKVKPQEVIYADDQEANLIDAKRMGIKTIFVKNYPQFKRELDKYLSYDK